MNRFVLSTLFAATTLAAAPAAQAQAGLLTGFQIGAAAGVAIPTGDFADSNKMGYNVTLAVGVRPAYAPVGVRLEAAYNQFGFEGGGGNVNVPAFTGNLIFGLPVATFSPYVIGGAGLYRVGVDLDGADNVAENHFGFNIGGGIKIPISRSFETFIEARYNRVSIDGENIAFVPITIGVLF